LAGSGVVLEISSVRYPHHSGSSGVTFTMIPHRAYVDLPTQTTRTSLGIRKYSTVEASAKLCGGMMQWSAFISTKERTSKFFGSTTTP
jgi:hypothetical protein